MSGKNFVFNMGFDPSYVQSAITAEGLEESSNKLEEIDVPALPRELGENERQFLKVIGEGAGTVEEIAEWFKVV